jgi:hypothetical protein
MMVSACSARAAKGGRGRDGSAGEQARYLETAVGDPRLGAMIEKYCRRS